MLFLSGKVWHIVLQISMVSGILAYNYGAPFAWITSLSVAAYIAFTLTVTQVLYFLLVFFFVIFFLVLDKNLIQIPLDLCYCNFSFDFKF